MTQSCPKAGPESVYNAPPESRRDSGLSTSTGDLQRGHLDVNPKVYGSIPQVSQVYRVNWYHRLLTVENWSLCFCAGVRLNYISRHLLSCADDNVICFAQFVTNLSRFSLSTVRGATSSAPRPRSVGTWSRLAAGSVRTCSASTRTARRAWPALAAVSSPPPPPTAATGWPAGPAAPPGPGRRAALAAAARRWR